MSYKRFFRAADIKKVVNDWLWEPYIPNGKVTMIHGDEGVGKTMLGIKLMASCTSKVRIDPYYGYLERCKCLYLTKEENLPAVIRPKLEEAGANLNDILIINDHLPLSLGDDSIRQIIEEENIGLLIIDPISSYLSSEVNLYDSPQDVKPIMRMLARLAEETGCAIVLIDQSDGIDSDQSKIWRFEFGSYIASYLCMEWEEDLDYEERMLYHEYSLLSMEGDPITYVMTPGKGMKCGR